MGKVGLREASGLAFSRKNLGFVWTLQDRGNNNSLYLLDANTGKTVAEYTIKGTKNRDWEDIEISIGPEPGKTYLYIGDTGNNNLDYEDYTIYRIEEPKFEENHRNQTLELDTAFDNIVFEYPDKSHDVEALLVDPKSGDIFMITKRDLFSLLFTLPYPQKTDGLNKAILTGTFPFRIATGGTVFANITSNDIVNGMPATLGATGNATVAVSGVVWPAGITLDPATGKVTVAAGTAPGRWAPAPRRARAHASSRTADRIAAPPRAPRRRPRGTAPPPRRGSRAPPRRHRRPHGRGPPAAPRASPRSAH